MDMQMRHFLPGIGAGVRDDTVASLDDALRFGNLLDDGQHLCPHLLAVQLVNALDMHLRDHQHMARRLWRNIVEGDNMFALSDKRRAHLPSRDLAEDANDLRMRHTESLLAYPTEDAHGIWSVRGYSQERVCQGYQK